MGAEQKLKELDIQLPEPVQPVASYIRCYTAIAVHLGNRTGRRDPARKAGKHMSVDEVYAAARKWSPDPGTAKARWAISIASLAL